MAVRVPLQFANSTMRLAAPVYDADGRLLAGRGTALEDRIMRALRRLAIQTVLVTDAEAVSSWEAVRPVTQEMRALDARFRLEPDSAPLREIHAAVARYLHRRAARMATEQQAEPPPEVATIPPPER